MFTPLFKSDDFYFGAKVGSLSKYWFVEITDNCPGLEFPSLLSLQLYRYLVYYPKPREVNVQRPKLNRVYGTVILNGDRPVATLCPSGPCKYPLPPPRCPRLGLSRHPSCLDLFLSVVPEINLDLQVDVDLYVVVQGEVPGR